MANLGWKRGGGGVTGPSSLQTMEGGLVNRKGGAERDGDTKNTPKHQIKVHKYHNKEKNH